MRERHVRSPEGSPLSNSDDLVARIVGFLARRGAPESSARLVERFLRMMPASEEQATRLLRPLLEPAGIGYRDGEGWSQGSVPPVQTSLTRTTVRAVVVDPERDALVAYDAGGEGPLSPDDIRWPETFAIVLDGPARGRLHAWLVERRLPAPARIALLRTLVRSVARVPRGAGLEEICSTLGVRWLDAGDAAGVAAAMAACLAETASRREEAGLEELGADETTPNAGEDLVVLPGTITADQLAAIPESPGVYRFFDRDDELLYVGKASNLKRRVSSYFSGRRTARHGERFLDRIHRLEYDPLPSELEALLREAKEIRGKKPRGNVQLEVHERPHAVLPLSTSRCWALLLPSPSPGEVTAILVRDGRYYGHVRIGPNGGGLAKSHRLLGKAVCGRKIPVGAQREPDRETQILGTWLAKYEDSVSRLDLGDCTKAAQAADALRAAARRMQDDTGRTDYR